MSEAKETIIYDIAEQLKISPATVSGGLKDHPAISKKTKRKIADVALNQTQNLYGTQTIVMRHELIARQSSSRN